VLELGVAVGMLAALAGPGVGLQAEADVLQPAADQPRCNRRDSHPQQRRLQVAANRRRDQLRQRFEQAGLLDHGSLAAAAPGRSAIAIKTSPI
jgi:hypothetical protein